MDDPFYYNKSISILKTNNDSFILVDIKEKQMAFSNQKITLHFYYSIISNKTYLMPFSEEFKKRKLVDDNTLRISPLYSSNQTSFTFVNNYSNHIVT